MNVKEKTIFDFAIIGAGAAGLNLVMAMLDDSFFKNKSILLLDKDPKVTNDHTWCYWESGKGKWDSIAHKIWEKGFFVSSEVIHQLDMNPYRYKMVRSADFYSFIKKRLEESPNVKWIREEVREVVEEEVVAITTQTATMFARQVFDSRIAKEFYQQNDSSIRILQHFKGWVVETEEDFFNPEEFVMMDFRVKWKNSASFTYVLPSTKRSALIEFTLFTTDLIEDKSYDAMLEKYCDEILNLKNYKIIEVEKGVIPMTDFPFHKYNTPKVTKIGTAGSWVKPSSGYSFKNAQKFSSVIIQNIKKGNKPSKGIANSRHRKYDSIFLGVLKNRNELGEKVFTDMYLKNPASRIFRFLDEQSTLPEDLKIISSFESAPFIESLLGMIRKKS